MNIRKTVDITVVLTLYVDALNIEWIRPKQVKQSHTSYFVMAGFQLDL